MPEATKKDTKPGDETLQGLEASRDDPAALISTIEKAFDYRGDVTVVTTDGRVITGYLFDRRKGATLAEMSVRLMLPEPAEGVGEKVTVRGDEIDRLAITGKDTAHGKSFERWVERFVEKKLSEAQGDGERGTD